MQTNPPNNEIRIRFRYSSEEYQSAYRLYTDHLPHVKRNIYLTLALMSAGVFLCVRYGYSLWTSLPIYAAVLYIVSLIRLIFISPSLNYQKFQYLKEEQIFHFLGDYVVFECMGNSVEMHWSSFLKYLEDDELYVLFHAPDAFLIIPKRAFKPDDLKTFKMLIAIKILRED